MENWAKTTKTEQEILEADKRELEIEAEKEVADRAARLEFQEATKKEWDRYTKIWHPAKERWEKFSQPFFWVCQAKLVVNDTAEFEALGKVRGNWGVCPRCGAPFTRYQTHCSGDKCGINLITGGTGRFINGKWVSNPNQLGDI